MVQLNKNKSCLECGALCYKKFCCRKHQNTYNSRIRHNRKKFDEVAVKKCKGCGIEFETKSSNSIFCRKQCGTKWRAKNIYKYKYSKISRGKDPITFLLSLRGHYKRHETISKEFLISLYKKQDGKCAISGEEMTHTTGNGYMAKNISIDRIDSSIGYIEGNIQLVCRIVNEMKRCSSVDELKIWCRKILEKQR